jgi:hypothetical protein
MARVDRKWSLNDGQRPCFRGVRVALSTGYNRVRGERGGSNQKTVSERGERREAQVVFQRAHGYPHLHRTHPHRGCYHVQRRPSTLASFVSSPAPSFTSTSTVSTCPLAREPQRAGKARIAGGSGRGDGGEQGGRGGCGGAAACPRVAAVAQPARASVGNRVGRGAAARDASPATRAQR